MVDRRRRGRVLADHEAGDLVTKKERNTVVWLLGGAAALWWVVQQQKREEQRIAAELVAQAKRDLEPLQKPIVT